MHALVVLMIVALLALASAQQGTLRRLRKRKNDVIPIASIFEQDRQVLNDFVAFDEEMSMFRELLKSPSYSFSMSMSTAT